MADEDANIICGMVYDQESDDSIRVTVVATGLSGESSVHLASIEQHEPAAAVQRMPNIQPIAAAPAPQMPSQQPAAASQAQPQSFGEVGFNDDEYAVPTFLRRQAD